MKPVLRAVCAWACAVLAGAVHADSRAPFLWQVQGPKAAHHLLGSVHLLPPSAHPLPPALDAAYAESRKLMFESDLEALASPELQGRMLGAAREDRPGGLKAHIGAELYQKLQTRAAKLGMPTPVCEDFRAWFCALAIELYPLQRSEFSPEHGVDQHFYTRAREDGRPVAGLELPEQQLALFTTMPETLSAQLLAATLDEATFSSLTPHELQRIWSSGATGQLEKLVKDLRRRYPQLHAHLLADRNRAWLPVLVQNLNGEAPLLVVVGAAHLVGPDGLLALLKAQGFNPKPVTTGTEVAKPTGVSAK
jgi:uncharacterized protein YbaP (TraB family)